MQGDMFPAMPPGDPAVSQLPDLPRLPLGARVQDPFVVLEVEQRESARGPFWTLTLGNATGRMPSAPVWSEQQEMVAGLKKGTVVQVIGEVSQFGGKRQLRLSSVRPIPRGAVDWDQLLPSIGDPAPWWARLDEWRARIAKPRLRAVLDLFYEDPDFRARYGACPGSTSGHHAALGGLLKHTVEIVVIGHAMARAARADADLVTAGALLHDIGKLAAYRWDGAFETTEVGALLGHVALGHRMLVERLATTDPRPCTEREQWMLEHFILSHHGKLEFGAAVPPMFVEAEILHYADDASAKTDSMNLAIADPDNFSEDAPVSARGVWQLDRRKVWRGGSDWGTGD